MTSNLKFEKNLWSAAEYKHVVLGLIFLRYISDAIEELYNKLEAKKIETEADPDDNDEYTTERIFYIPPLAFEGIEANKDEIKIDPN